MLQYRLLSVGFRLLSDQLFGKKLVTRLTICSLVFPVLVLGSGFGFLLLQLLVIAYLLLSSMKVRSIETQVFSSTYVYQQDAQLIMITCPCNVYPLTSHFYIVKLGFTRVYRFFLFSL